MAKQRPTKKVQIKLLPPHDDSTEDTDIEDVFIFEEADLTILFNALRTYKPSESEEQRYEILLGTLDEQISTMQDTSN